MLDEEKRRPDLRLDNYANVQMYVEHEKSTEPGIKHKPTGRYYVVINSNMGEVRLYKFFKEQFDDFMSRLRYLL